VLKTYEPNQDEEGNGEDCITKNFIICIPHQILFRCSNQVRGGLGIWHVWDSGEVNTRFWWGNLRERDHSEGLGVNGRIIMDLQEMGCGTWTGFHLLRIGPGDGLLRMR